MAEKTFSSSRIARNTIALYVRSFISMIIGLYSSRVLLNVLGVENFGIYQAVGGMVALFGFLNSTMLVSSQRFLSFEIGRNNPKGVREVFCMSVNIQFLIATLMCVVCDSVGVYAVENIMTIPESRIYATYWVLHLSVVALFISIVSVPYNAMIIAKEDMKSFAYIDILGSILKLVAVLALTKFSFDYLILYSGFVVLIQLIIRYLYSRVCYKKFEEAKYRLSWNRCLFRDMIGFSGWTTLSAITYMGRIQGITVMYNVFGGVIINAALGIANQVNNAIVTLVNSFTTSFNPQITKCYAAEDFEQCRKIHFTGPKLSFFLVSVISAPVFINAEYILQLWLKKVPDFTTIFIWLILIESLFRALIATSNTVIRATGKVGNYEIICNVIHAFFLLGAFLCFKLNTNIYYPYTCLVVATIIVGIFMVYKSSNVLKIAFPDYLINVYLRMLIPYLLIIFVFIYFMPKASNFYILIIETLVIIFSVVVVEYLLGFNKHEKNFIIRHTLSKISHKI